MIFSPFSWRLWKISRFGVFEDRPESSGPAVEIYGIFGGEDGGAGEPVHERTLLHPLPREEQRSAARLRSHRSSWYSQLYSAAVPQYSGEDLKIVAMNMCTSGANCAKIPQ